MVTTRSNNDMKTIKNVSSRKKASPQSSPMKSKNNNTKKTLKSLGKLTVDFGMYKDKEWTYDQLIKNREVYAKIITRENYDVPNDFKTYMCFKYI